MKQTTLENVPVDTDFAEQNLPEVSQVKPESGVIQVEENLENIHVSKQIETIPEAATKEVVAEETVSENFNVEEPKQVETIATTETVKDHKTEPEVELAVAVDIEEEQNVPKPDETHDLDITVDTSETVTSSKPQELGLVYSTDIETSQNEVTTLEASVTSEKDIQETTELTEDVSVLGSDSVSAEIAMSKDIPDVSLDLQQEDLEYPDKKTIPKEDILDSISDVISKPTENEVKEKGISSTDDIPKEKKENSEEGKTQEIPLTVEPSKNEEDKLSDISKDEVVAPEKKPELQSKSERLSEQTKFTEIPEKLTAEKKDVPLETKHPVEDKISDFKDAEIHLPAKTQKKVDNKTTELIDAEIDRPVKTKDTKAEISVQPIEDKEISSTTEKTPEEVARKLDSLSQDIYEEEMLLQDKGIDLPDEEISLPSKPAAAGDNIKMIHKENEDEMKGCLSDHELEFTVDTEEIPKDTEETPEETAYDFDVSIDTAKEKPSITPKGIDFAYDVDVHSPTETQTNVDTLSLEETSADFEVKDVSENIQISEESIEYKIAQETTEDASKQNLPEQQDDFKPAEKQSREPLYRSERQTGKDIEKVVEKHKGLKTADFDKPEGEMLKQSKVEKPFTLLSDIQDEELMKLGSVSIPVTVDEVKPRKQADKIHLIPDEEYTLDKESELPLDKSDNDTFAEQLKVASFDKPDGEIILEKTHETLHSSLERPENDFDFIKEKETPIDNKEAAADLEEGIAEVTEVSVEDTDLDKGKSIEMASE